VFDWSYHKLTAEQARLFRRLGLHPGPEISFAAAAAIADREKVETQQLLDSLADGHLIEKVARNRYRFHDLLRAYAAHCANRDDMPTDRHHARQAVLQWYAHNAKTAFAVTNSGAGLHAGADFETSGYPEIMFAGASEAWTWFDLERVNLVAATHDAARHALPELTVLLADLAMAAPFRPGERDDAFDMCRLGLNAARHLGDRNAEFHLLQSLSHTHRRMAQWQDASVALQRALTLACDLDDSGLQAGALSDLGLVSREQGQYTEAIRYLQLALPLCLRGQYGWTEGTIQLNLSAAYTGLGNCEEALWHAERCLTLMRESGNPVGEALALHCMGLAWQGAGCHSDAIALWHQALGLECERLHPPENAAILDALGTSLQHIGDTAEAITCWRAALRTFDQYADHRANDLRNRLQKLESDEFGAP
jgi:tetratricopeptide (TPR) repeat protein